MISVVNGYVCTTSCEAAAARAGKDPNAPPGSPPGTHKKSPFDNQPATVLGGALKNALSAVTPAGSATPPANSQPTVDRLA
jgi:hypothetical protein